MIVYFSGTGNSAYCARFLARRLGDECLDSFQYIRNGIAADLRSGTPWVFVSPTYAWRIPRIFEQFLRSGAFQGSGDAYFVLTCGSEMGDAPRYNQALCQQLGLNYCGTLEIVMPENYIALFDTPEPEEARRIVSAATPVLEEGAACIRGGKNFPKPKVNPLDWMKSVLVNPVFYPVIVKAKKFAVSDACVSCGKCERACPLQNIHMVAGRPVWGERCTHCMACICGCPAQAIEYGRISVGKPRYQCPEMGNQHEMQ